MPSRPELSASSANFSPSPSSPDPPAGRDPRAVEQQLRGRRAGQAHLVLDGRCGSMPLVAASASRQLMPRRPASAGADHERVEVGLPGVGDPRLRPGHHVTRRRRAPRGWQRRRVRPGLGLGQRVGAEQLPGQHVRQPARLAAPPCRSGQRIAGHRVHRQADADRHPRRGEFLEHLEVDLVADRAAAPLLRVRQAEQSAPAEQPELLAGESAARLVLARDRGQFRARQVPGQRQQVRGLRAGQHPLGGHNSLPPLGSRLCLPAPPGHQRGRASRAR